MFSLWTIVQSFLIPNRCLKSYEPPLIFLSLINVELKAEEKVKLSLLNGSKLTISSVGKPSHIGLPII